MPMDPSSALMWTSISNTFYILAGQKRRGEGDLGGVVAAHDLEHVSDVGIHRRLVETGTPGEEEAG